MSLSSTGEVALVPMKILDDISICEQRAIIRASIGFKGTPTEQERAGKVWWTKKREQYRKLISSVLGAKLGAVWIEHDLSLTYVGSKKIVYLNGLADMVVFASIECEDREWKRVGSIPVLVLFEFTTYECIEGVVDRVLAYASATFNRYGFPVIPVIIVLRDFEHDIVDKCVIISNANRIGVVPRLQARLSRLEKLLLGELKPRHASAELCPFCDIDIRRICPHRM